MLNDTAADVRVDLGRHVFGLAAIFFGFVTFVFHDFDTWHQLRSLWNTPEGAIFVYAAATAEIIGGVAIQWRRSASTGALVLGLVYLFFALRWIPRILSGPLIYDHWGNLFEQLSLVSGAMIVYGSTMPDVERAARICRIGYVLFAVCVISFALEQLVYLTGTAGFVPKWIPPGQMFWAVTTTIAFALAAIGLLSGRQALLASELLTLMIAIFGLLVWLPMLIADPHNHTNWGGNAENWAIAGAAWIVTDDARRAHLQQARSRSHASTEPVLSERSESKGSA